MGSQTRTQRERDNRKRQCVICTFGEKHESAIIIFTWKNKKQRKWTNETERCATKQSGEEGKKGKR